MINYNDIIKFFKNSELPNVYDVEICKLNELRNFDSFECHIVLYPYSRKISSENISFNPFEDYAKDISTRQRSAYIRINKSFNDIFGLFIGLIIGIIFYFFKPQELYTVEAIVSILGAYFIGKDIWDDIERFLIQLSQNWKIKYLENYYSYQLEKFTTLTYYSALAQKNRYGKASLMPEKMDFIQKCNSLTVRMFFHIKDLKMLKDNTAHLLSIHVDSDLLQEFKEKGFMLGVKISFNKKILCFLKCTEFFQSLNNKIKGCLDEKGQWTDNAIFFRNTISIGRLKYFRKKDVLENESLIN